MINKDRGMVRIFIPYLMLGFIVSGCGISTTTKQILTIYMQGNYSAPDDATGNETPISQAYTLNSVQVQVDGGAALEFLTATPRESTIVNRSQIIFSKDISDYNGVRFSGAALGFSSAVTGKTTGGTAVSTDITSRLTSGAIPITEAFTVEEGKGLDINIKVNWKNTVSSSTMEAPTYTVTVSST